MRMLVRSAAVVVAASIVAISGVATLSNMALAKGEPQPSKCDRFKKNSPEWKRCVGQLKDDLSDNELFYAGYWLARTGEYAEALSYLSRARVKDERILTYIGFATRKLGQHDAAVGFYGRALALNPTYTVARAYLGEALVERGDFSGAREQLGLIEQACGTSCADYQELSRQIAAATQNG